MGTYIYSGDCRKQNEPDPNRSAESITRIDTNARAGVPLRRLGCSSFPVLNAIPAGALT